MPKSAGTILPNEVLRGGRHRSVTINQTVNVSVAGSVTTKTAQQIGREGYRAVTSAARRLGS
jgi:hypothetical protein